MATIATTAIPIPEAEIRDFCHRHHVRRLALFGSVLRDDFSPDSDIDVLVEFHPDHVPGYITLGFLADELSALFGHREIDLLTPKAIIPPLRDRIVTHSHTLYEG